MGRLIDLTGKRFGNLVVKERAEKDKNKHALWLCECDCGNKTIIRGDSLIRGMSVSCGCYKRKKIDDEIQKLIGRKFGRLTVISRAPNYISPKGKIHAMLECKCDCGNITIVEKYSVISGTTKSCGCLQKEAAASFKEKHGMYGTHIYHVWDSMIGRCYRESNPRYDRYGGRGISVCDEWRQFNNFYEYVSTLPHYNEEGYSLDRINNNGNYEPGNVRWADDETQANNKSKNHYITYNNKTQTIAQWAKELGMQYNTLSNRIYYGWPIKKALTIPVQTKKIKY